MSFFQLNTAKCKKDGICAKSCPVGIIKNDANQIPYINDSSASRCLECGHCVAYCPHLACSVESLDPDQFDIVERDRLPDFENVELLLKSRRSERTYKKTIVDSSIMDKIFDIVRYAPTAKNTQSVRWVMTSSQEQTKKVALLSADAFENAAKMTSGAEAIGYKTLARAQRQGMEIFTRGAPQLVVAVVDKKYDWSEDGVIALTYLEIAAYSAGLGTCWGGYITSALRGYQPLREFLGISEDEYICGVQLIGYPIFKPKAIPSRNAANVTII